MITKFDKTKTNISYKNSSITLKLHGKINNFKQKTSCQPSSRLKVQKWLEVQGKRFITIMVNIIPN